MTEVLPRLEQEMARYVRLFPEMQEVAGMHADIFRFQEDLKARLGSVEPADPARSMERLSRCGLLLEEGAPSVPQALLREAARSLAMIWQKWNEDFSAESLLGARQMSEEHLPSLVHELRNHPGSALAKLSEETGLEQAGLAFFMRTLMTPFYEREASRYRELLRGLSWRSGSCPVCGSPPGMAQIRRDGRRMLHCSLCRTEWEFQRIGCPFCRNTEQDKLRYFHLEGDPGHRVDVCEKCRKYVKTSDGKMLPQPLTPQVEVMAMLPLDCLAEEEGYSPGDSGQCPQRAARAS
ncbi:MAG: formate dehydrogenase accessory protein FdhE [Chloroflexi bacterium]|nr:formate dehydrogenase accessory protein FdhE [Chloroflexota bacterium]